MSEFTTNDWNTLVGKEVVNEFGEIFKVVSLARYPSVCLESKEGHRIDFCVGSPMSTGWRDYEEKVELKTLKDLKRCPDCNAVYEKKCVDFEELKAEAVKRVLNCCSNDNVGGKPLRKSERCEACKRDIWFNNLTEEDLKDV